MGDILSGAYYVGQIRVKDVVAWREYVGQVAVTVHQYGGEILFRGANGQMMAGHQFAATIPLEQVVALQFANEADAKRWHDSPEYQRLIPSRDRGADVILILYTG